MTTGRINQVAFLHDVAAHMIAPAALQQDDSRHQINTGHERHSFKQYAEATRSRDFPSISCRQMHRIQESEHQRRGPQQALERLKRNATRALGFVVHPSKAADRKGLTRRDTSIA